MQLATCDLYQDFILLDPSDAATVDEYLKNNESGKGNLNADRGKSSLGPRSGKSILSPFRQADGIGHKSSVKKNIVNDLMSPGIKDTFESKENDIDSGPSPGPHNTDFGFDMNNDYSDHADLNNDEDEEDDDVWKPLNPHELGNLKIKPFKKGNCILLHSLAWVAKHYIKQSLVHTSCNYIQSSVPEKLGRIPS